MQESPNFITIVVPNTRSEILHGFNVGDVIYNAQFPLIAPDIVFGPEDEHFRPYSVTGEGGDSMSHKNCLSDWNCKDPTRLLALILELRLGSLFIILCRV